MQIMGPLDSYILQFSRNIASFWATPYSLALGARFRSQPDRAFVQPPRQLVTQARLYPCLVARARQAFIPAKS